MCLLSIPKTHVRTSVPPELRMCVCMCVHPCYPRGVHVSDPSHIRHVGWQMFAPQNLMDVCARALTPGGCMHVHTHPSS